MTTSWILGSIVFIQIFHGGSLNEQPNNFGLDVDRKIVERGYGFNKNPSYSNYDDSYGYGGSNGRPYGGSNGSSNGSSSSNKPIINTFVAQSKQKQNIEDQCFNSNSIRCNTNSKYRTIDGTCNNIQKPWWGAVNTAHVRLIRAKYQDGISEYRRSVVDNSELPSARFLSTTFLPNRNIPDIHTRMYLQFSQLVAHDVTLNPQKSGQGCCSSTGNRVQSTTGVCRPIKIPNNDPFFSQFNRQCLDYKQSETTNCSVGPLQLIVQSTHFIDCSFMYGSENDKASSLRTGNRGQLRTRQVNGKSYLPTNSSNCPFARRNCYDAGDVRVNQQLDLAVTQTMMLRFHNYVANKLIEVNPRWRNNDEIVYQEARRIVIAVFQHIVYNDWLPILIGASYAADVGLTPQPGSNYFNGYNENVNPSTLTEFSAGAFRGLHSLIPDHIDLVSEQRNINRQYRYSETLQRPGDYLEDGDTYDSTLRGLTTQPEQMQDQYMTEEITNYFFDGDVPSNAQRSFGDDLCARDIQRGRDFGIGTYLDYRALCGLSDTKEFRGLNDYIQSKETNKLSQVYKSPADIDYYIGGLLEQVITGTLSSPSFRCVFAEAFYRYKYGDRYFYEYSGSPGAFSRAQLNEIKKITLSHIICVGGDNIASIQANAFYLPGQGNSLIPCSQLKFDLDFSCFADMKSNY